MKYISDNVLQNHFGTLLCSTTELKLHPRTSYCKKLSQTETNVGNKVEIKTMFCGNQENMLQLSE